jgi:hypothetical protein
VSDQVYGEAPPLAVRFCEYGNPTCATGKVEDVVTVSGLIAIASVNVWLAVAEVESVTLTVKVEVTAAVVGVPWIEAVAVGTVPVVPGTRERPLGSAPEVIDHVYGGAPPMASRDAEYPLPRKPAGSVAVAITRPGGPGRTTSVKVW